jgi:diguanylate cyclase (GGDEF)-like protein
VVRLLATIPCAIAAIVIAGWALGDDTLKRVGLGSVTMNPITALAFLLFGAGLVARSRNGRKATTFGTVLIGGAGCIGAIKLVDLIFGTHFDIDAILFPSQLSAGYVRPSRMAPNTAGSLAMISIALLLMRSRSDRAVVTAQSLACLASLVAIFTMVGHLYGVAAFYVVAAMHPMALHAAIAFLSLSGYIMRATADRGLMARISDPGPAGRLSRALLPAALVIPVLLGWLRQEGEIAGLFSREAGIAIMVMLTMLSMTVLIWLNAGWLLASDKLRRLAEAEVAHLARHDFLTGLPNRSQFMERLEARVVPGRRRADTLFAIVTMDLDGFKQVNDQLGHAAGDALLRNVALFLKGCIYRQDDLVARLGGDEFVMLLDRVSSAEEVAVVAHRIVANMPRQFGPEGETVAIGISAGIVLADRSAQTSESLLNKADLALYHAKRTGKGRFSLYQAVEGGAFEGAL